ncbi:MAG: hypothetical protein WAU81_07410 [Candidatus Aminicenantales bacterium]
MNNARTSRGFLETRFGQFSVLSRHFFHRFFQNDIVDFEDQMKEKVIGGMAFLAILGVQIANAILLKYPFLDEEGPSWVDKCYFFWIFMLLLGLITVVEWDVIFPDRRDYLNLMPLPVRLRTLFLAKSASFFLFIGLFSAAAHAPASFSFAYFLTRFRSNSFLFLLRYIAAHVIAGSAANIFLFFLCVFLQGLLMCLLSYGMYRRASLILRFVLMTSIVFLLIVSLTASVSIPQSFSNFPAMKESQARFLYAFPPMWFVGLYEYLLGNRDAFFAALSRFAVWSVLASILTFFGTAAISYSHHLKKSQEVRRGRVFLKRTRDLLSRAFDAVLLRNPTQRAVFHFFGQTLSRSPVHKMRLFNYLAVSSGISLIMLGTTQFMRGQTAPSNRTVLAIPLVLSFSLLLGIRALANVPASLEANWIFQITERAPRRHYFAGLKKAVIIEALLPLFILVFIFYRFFWEWRPALLHGFFGLAASILLLEGLFWQYPKVPFTCTYVPGKAKVHVYWLPYVCGFLIYVYFLSSLERFLFVYPKYFLNCFVTFGVLIVASQFYQNFYFYRRRPIIYHEEPEPVMISLESPT